MKAKKIGTEKTKARYSFSSAETDGEDDKQQSAESGLFSDITKTKDQTQMKIFSNFV